MFSDFGFIYYNIEIFLISKWPNVVHNDTWPNRANLSDLIVIYPIVAFALVCSRMSF